MEKVDPQAVMALRQLTDLPLSACRAALVAAGCDVSAAVVQLRLAPCGGIYATEAEIAAVPASRGLRWSPPEHRPRAVPDDEVVAELTFGGQTVSDFCLVGGLICRAFPSGGLVARVIEDRDLATATRAYLRRAGVREFGTVAEFQTWQSRTGPDATTDRGPGSDS